MPEVTDPALLKELNASRVPPTPEEGKPRPRRKRIGDFTEGAVGVSQGLLDPVEGAAQFAEQVLQKLAPGTKVAPDSVRNWARDWRNRARS